MSDEHISIDGRMIRVRSCTERRGVWVEMFWPQRKKDPLDRMVESITGREDQHFAENREPDDYLFIPGDIRESVAESITQAKLEVSNEDDEYEGAQQ